MKSLPPISENRATTLTLRPPRVVVLFRGGPRWQDWARLAIAAASRVWGGGGFAFVPFDVDGGVHPKVLELASRYDPDYVAVASHGIAEWNRIAPELLNLPEGFDIDELQTRDPRDVHDQVALSAANTVIEACNPLAMSISADIPHWYRLSGSEPVTSSTQAKNALHRCFNCYFPVPGAPRAFPDHNQLLPLFIGPLNFHCTFENEFSDDSQGIRSWGYYFNSAKGHIDGLGSSIYFTFTDQRNGQHTLSVYGYVQNQNPPGGKAGYLVGALSEWLIFDDHIAGITR